MSYFHSGPEKIIENPFVRDSIKKSKHYIFLPSLLFVFMVIIGIFLILHKIVSDIEVVVAFSFIVAVLLGYHFYLKRLGSWVAKEVLKPRAFKKEWATEVNRTYFSERFFLKSSSLKKIKELLDVYKKEDVSSIDEKRPLNFPEKYIMKVSKKRAILVLISVIIVILFFTNQYLYPIYQGGIVTDSGNQTYYSFQLILGVLGLTGIIQIARFFKKGPVLIFSDQGIYHDDYLYKWEYISDSEVVLDTDNSKRTRILYHYLNFEYNLKKISINLNPLDKNSQEIATALWYYRKG